MRDRRLPAVPFTITSGFSIAKKRRTSFGHTPSSKRTTSTSDSRETINSGDVEFLRIHLPDEDVATIDEIISMKSRTNSLQWDIPDLPPSYSLSLGSEGVSLGSLLDAVKKRKGELALDEAKAIALVYTQQTLLNFVRREGEEKPWLNQALLEFDMRTLESPSYPYYFIARLGKLEVDSIFEEVSSFVQREWNGCI